MVRLLRVMAIAAAVGAFIGWVAGAFADHNIYLPYVPQTPLMQQVIGFQEYSWCTDSRASTYPNFVDQVRDVQDEYAARVGIRYRQVSFLLADGKTENPDCMVRHTMPDTVSCIGCAAYIYYASKPVDIVYKWALGYFDWRSAIGHELGHGLLGLHEQYKDSGGSIGCVYRDDTVMSCGPPYVKYPQPRDVNYGCDLIETSWCGVTAPPVDPCDGPADEYGNEWDNCLQRWIAPNGMRYDPVTGIWEIPDGTPWFSGCDPYANRFSLYLLDRTGEYAFLPVGGWLYIHSKPGWWQVPPC